MNFLNIVDNLIPSDMIPSKKEYIDMFNQALGYLNDIKLSRFKAMYFGSLQLGPDFYTWKDDKKDKEFTQKYQSCCIFIMDNLYNELKDKKQELVEVSLSILYSMLAMYVERKDFDLSNLTKELLEENDKYVKDSDFDNEFHKEENNG